MMRTTIEISGTVYHIDFAKPIDLSIPLSPSGPRAWYVDPMRIEPVLSERFTGSVAMGGDVNFRQIWFNPHGHGTHTECAGHIEGEVLSINETLKTFVFLAGLISVYPEKYTGKELAHMKPGDAVITKDVIASQLLSTAPIEALIVRTLPNDRLKLSRNYSNSNPPYFSPEALHYLRSRGVKHLLTDLPSVDREEDGGALLAHRAFWYSRFEDDLACTITEMIYVPDSVADGEYILNLQIASFENDASPSKPVIYPLLARQKVEIKNP